MFKNFKNEELFISIETHAIDRDHGYKANEFENLSAIKVFQVIDVKTKFKHETIVFFVFTLPLSFLLNRIKCISDVFLLVWFFEGMQYSYSCN